MDWTRLTALTLALGLHAGAYAQDGEDPYGSTDSATDTTTDGTSDGMSEDSSALPEVSQGFEAPSGQMGLEGAAPLVAGQGKIVINGFLSLNLSKSLVFKPISVAPDIWYGIDGKLAVGLTHSGVASDGFVGGPGAGICLGSTCPTHYGNTGLLGRYSLDIGNKDLVLAADGGLVFRSWDPFAVAIKAGVVGQWTSGKILAEFRPNFHLGLSNRNAGNKEFFNVPAAVLYAVNEQLSIGGQSGFSVNNGNLRIPLSFIGRFALNQQTTVGGSFNFENLLGDGSTANIRSLMFMLGYRLP